jgi:hypothetical protein
MIWQPGHLLAVPARAVIPFSAYSLPIFERSGQNYVKMQEGTSYPEFAPRGNPDEMLPFHHIIAFYRKPKTENRKHYQC